MIFLFQANALPLLHIIFFYFRSTYKHFVREVIIEQCKGTKSGKDSKEFDVDHVSKEKIFYL